jgi:hypothetical protein
MNGRDAALNLRKLANAIERFDRVPGIRRDVLDEECQLGAAGMIVYLRDLFTIANKEQFTRDELLVLLNNIQNDRELFTVDLVTLMGEE